MSQKFEVTSGKLVLTDPCYKIPTWCQGVVDNVKKGTWVTDVEKTDGSDGWGVRCGALYAVNEEALNKNPNLIDKVRGFGSNDLHLLDFDGGVDSGQFGYFDHEHYRNDESAKDLPKEYFGEGWDEEAGDVWYRACAVITLADVSWGVLPHGVVSSSGYGDGSYPTYGIKDENGEYVAFITIFIGMEEEDEWDDDLDDDDDI